GWGDFSDYGEGGRLVDGGAYAGEVGGSSGVESDWGGTAEDTASLSDGSLDPVGQQPDSSPTAYAEYTGVHPDYVRDYYQSQFSIPRPPTPQIRTLLQAPMIRQTRSHLRSTIQSTTGSSRVRGPTSSKVA